MATICNRSFLRTIGCNIQFYGFVNSCLLCPFPPCFTVHFNPFILGPKISGLEPPPLCPHLVFHLLVPFLFSDVLGVLKTSPILLQLALFCAARSKFGLPVMFIHFVLPLLNLVHLFPLFVHSFQFVVILPVFPLFPCPNPKSCSVFSLLYWS